MPALQETGLALLSTTAIADMTSVAATALYTVPVGKTCILSHAWLKVTADMGANLAFTLGRSTALTDWITLINGDNLNAALDCIYIAPVPSATPATLKEYAAGVIISLDLTVAGSAGAGTFYLFGFLDDA
jgi:hypothetical protein